MTCTTAHHWGGTGVLALRSFVFKSLFIMTAFIHEDGHQMIFGLQTNNTTRHHYPVFTSGYLQILNGMYHECPKWKLASR